MAKELAMVEHSQKSLEACRYFIESQRQLIEVSLLQNFNLLYRGFLPHITPCSSF